MSADRTSRLTRRELIAGVMAAEAVVLMGCGDGLAGPALGLLTVPTVRVRLGRARKQADLRLGAGDWAISGTEGRAFTWKDPGALKAGLSLGAQGILVGGRESGATALRIEPAGAFLLDENAYAGRLLVRKDGANLLFVNELDLETYVAGVIANECAPGAQPSTHRAQAVTSRTYAYVRVTASGADDDVFHLQDSESSQVYRGLTIRPEMALTPSEMSQRAAETRGVVLTWQSRPFSTYFASTCGGHTTEATTSELDPGAAAEPLRGVACGFCATSPKYRWTKFVSDVDLVAGMKHRGFPVIEPLTEIAVTQAGRGGWAKVVTVTYGPQGSRRPLPGTQFRSAARLNSHRLIDIRRVADGFEIDGAGWGHGVGMCQWGSFEMGKRGFSETDILRTYYPGITFTRVY